MFNSDLCISRTARISGTRQIVETSDYQRQHSIISEVHDQIRQPHIQTRDVLRKTDQCDNEGRSHGVP